MQKVAQHVCDEEGSNHAVLILPLPSRLPRTFPSFKLPIGDSALQRKAMSPPQSGIVSLLVAKVDPGVDDDSRFNGRIKIYEAIFTVLGAGPAQLASQMLL